jgi:glycosyltransferase involved in cell wall biosynthesis
VSGAGERNGGLRVAFVSFDFGEYCVPIASALARAAVVRLMLPDRELREGLELDSRVDVVTFRKPRLRQPVRQIRVCGELVRQIHSFSPDVIHLQQGHLWFNMVLPLLRRYPLVLTIHDHQQHLGDRGARRTPQAIMSYAFRRGDQLIVHSAWQRQQVIAQQRIHPDDVHVIPHVALARVDADARPDEQQNVVLFFGRIWPYKGLEYLIRAEPLVAASVPDVRVVIAGEGEPFERYRTLMARPDRFQVVNEFVSAQRRAELFASASVVVLPYVEASQSGIVPIAYAFGKPVVATAVGGLPESVEHGRTGFVVPPRDEAALAQAITTLLQDRDLRQELGRRGREKLESEWSAAAVARRTLAVYERAANGRR